MTTTGMSAVERMTAEWSCERLVKQFAQLNDNWDHDGIAELFVENGRFSRPLAPDNYIEGREAIRVMFRDRPLRLARHIMTTIVIEVLSPSQARGRCYLLYVSNPNAKAAVPALAEPSLMFGQFDDTFMLTEDGWRFEQRRGSVVLKT